MFFLQHRNSVCCYRIVLIKSISECDKFYFMKKLQRNLLLSLVMAGATIVGWVKGTEAKQKMVYRWKMSFEEKRALAKKRMAQRQGQVMLDDIEWAAYHNN